MLIPNFSQFSTHVAFGRLYHKAYLQVPYLDHVCVYMDVDGKAISSSIYVPKLKMFFESKDGERNGGTPIG